MEIYHRPMDGMGLLYLFPKKRYATSSMALALPISPPTRSSVQRAMRNVYLGFRNGHGQRDGFGVMQPGLFSGKGRDATGTETMKPLAASTICSRVFVLCFTCLVSFLFYLIEFLFFV